MEITPPYCDFQLRSRILCLWVAFQQSVAGEVIKLVGLTTLTAKVNPAFLSRELLGAGKDSHRYV